MTERWRSYGTVREKILKLSKLCPLYRPAFFMFTGTNIIDYTSPPETPLILTSVCHQVSPRKYGQI